MAVVLRMRRMGATNKPFFRVVAADERTSNKGRFIETLGWFSPKDEGVNYKLDLERIDYWRDTGARTSETVESLIKRAKKQQERPEAEKSDSSEQPVKMEKVADLPEDEGSQQVEKDAAKESEKDSPAEGSGQEEKPKVETEEAVAEPEKEVSE